MALEAQDGDREPAGDGRRPTASSGPRSGRRRVALLVDAEQLAGCPREIRAPRRSNSARRVAADGEAQPRETAGWPVTGASKLTRLIQAPRSQPCALNQCPGS
jgi:hypothetical protein